MRKIAIANRKGGVAKTTSAVHLSAALALAGNRVLLIDTDTQAHCSRLLGVNPPLGLSALVESPTQAPEILFPARENLDLLAGGKELAGTNRLIARESIRSELVLSKALEVVEGQYDYIVVDTPPSHSELTINVMFFVAEIIVPVSMEVLSTEGLVRFNEEIDRIREYHDVTLRFVLPTFLDGRVRKTHEILAMIEKSYGSLVTNPIHYSTALSEASGWGQTIFEYRPRDRAAMDYAKVAREVA